MAKSEKLQNQQEGGTADPVEPRKIPGQKEKKRGPKKVTRVPGLTKEAQLKLEKRRAIVASNLLAGLNYRDMATALDVSIGTISNDVSIILGRWREEQIHSVDQINEIELRRLDTMLNSIWADAKSGKLGHVDRVLKIREARAKIIGSDAPEKHEINLCEMDANDLNDDQLAEIAASGKPKPSRSGKPVAGTKTGKKKPD